MADWMTARVLRTETHTDGLFTLTLDAELPWFQAGQWTSLRLEKDGAQRPYSLASAPGEPPSFYIRRVDDGALTPALAALAVGDTVQVDAQVQGSFCLEHVPNAHTLWMIGTGTGVAPYLSMLGEGTLWTRFARVVLVYGVRVMADLAYRRRLDQLAAERPFSWAACVSRQIGALPGRITTCMADGSLAAALGTPNTDDHVLLCGNPAMVKEVRTQLKDLGLTNHRRRSPGHITVERYW